MLRAHREGVLHFEEHFVPTPFVSDPTDGTLVMPAPVALFFAPEAMLFVPEESDEALQLLLDAEQIEESAITDRWRAYHGEPEQVRWARCHVDAAKRSPWVFDGDALMLANELAGGEAGLVKRLNARKDELARVVAAKVGREPTESTAVGVDEWGAYVRVALGVVRLEFAEQAASLEEAERMIDALLERGGEAGA